MSSKRPLSVKQVLRWADAHHARTGKWPKVHSGPIKESPQDTWSGINGSLRSGYRGFPVGSSLPRFLETFRGTRNQGHLSRLSVRQILGWADAHYERTGKWPGVLSGQVVDAPGETWSGISQSLTDGRRGLRRGSSLAKLLGRYRGKRSNRNLPRLTIAQVLRWADAHHARTDKWPTCFVGTWPNRKSRPVTESPGETWVGINSALTHGGRGLPGGSSVAGLLAERRGTRNHSYLPPLNIRQILVWADEYHRRHKKWPRENSGPAKDALGETWSGINSALRNGKRGLPPGYSLARVMAERRGVRNYWSVGRLTIKQILTWADKYKSRKGRWPGARSGLVIGGRGETWNGINMALKGGLRGLAGGESLFRLLTRRR